MPVWKFKLDSVWRFELVFLVRISPSEDLGDLGVAFKRSDL
jgi:hypothetical protein